MDRSMGRMTFGRKSCSDSKKAAKPSEQLRRKQSLVRGTHIIDHCDVFPQFQYKKYLQQKRYKSYLDEAFELEPLKVEDSNEELQGQFMPPWPCIPRKKCYLSSADSILDLPTYSYAAFPELLDWSSENILVAALGRHYHKWSWQTQNPISEGFTKYDIQCCKFDPRGELLALGTTLKMVEIHDTALSKWVAGSSCKCELDQFCSITAVDWSPTGNSFITGCSRGTLVSLTRQCHIIGWRRATRAAILVVRVSPDARYVAAAAVNGDTVMLFTWPSLEQFAYLCSNWTIKALTWHPWRSALLGIGSVTSTFHARFVLWNAPNDKIRKTSRNNCTGRTQYSLDAMLFSHKTGELVLSLWNGDRTGLENACSQLVVMSDFDTVVDQWGEGRMGLDRVRTMIFSPDGTKLATATADEDLVIWNFLPEDGKKPKKNCRRFSAIPVYLDEASHGSTFR